MKKHIKNILMETAVMFIFTTLLLINAVFAEPGDTANKMVDFTWTANIEADLAGYKMYHGKEFLVDISDPAAVRCEYLVEKLLEGENIFNMTAYDTSGNESGFSGDAILIHDNIAPGIPAKVIIERLKKTKVTIETWE